MKYIKKEIFKVWEIAQLLKALGALPEDQGLVPNTHIAANKCL